MGATMMVEGGLSCHDFTALQTSFPGESRAEIPERAQMNFAVQHAQRQRSPCVQTDRRHYHHMEDMPVDEALKCHTPTTFSSRGAYANSLHPVCIVCEAS